MRRRSVLVSQRHRRGSDCPSNYQTTTRPKSLTDQFRRWQTALANLDGSRRLHRRLRHCPVYSLSDRHTNVRHTYRISDGFCVCAPLTVSDRGATPFVQNFGLPKIVRNTTVVSCTALNLKWCTLGHFGGPCRRRNDGRHPCLDNTNG